MIHPHPLPRPHLKLKRSETELILSLTGLLLCPLLHSASQVLLLEFQSPQVTLLLRTLPPASSQGPEDKVDLLCGAPKSLYNR